MTVDYRELNKVTPAIQAAVPDLITDITESPVKWGVSYDQLTEEQQKHTWFTDGSAKMISSSRKWKAVAYNPSTQQTIVTTGDNMSSQYAELYAVYQALQQEQGQQCHIYTDSWAVAQGLAMWMPQWKKHDWKINDKEIWGKKLWEDIWLWCQNTIVTVFHVDAHSSLISAERKHNSHANQLVQIRATHNPGLAQWVHEKSGHLGEQASYRYSCCVRYAVIED
ncbi:ribonuclease H-like [Diceros bicornis minor]|uniref:ribonuclease H-like n=1 Tax=Diceros bicornis minor TaxID=77932 RepID=UPI0026F152D6|nr:ribonuclease H-like [Diceros bicornis minor]